MIVSPAVQDIIASQFASELEYGVDDYPNGCDEKFYARAAGLYLAAAKMAARAGKLTFADLMLGQLYRVLTTEDIDELRFQLTGLLTQGLQWREALDRRKAEAQ